MFWLKVFWIFCYLKVKELICYIYNSHRKFLEYFKHPGIGDEFDIFHFGLIWGGILTIPFTIYCFRSFPNHNILTFFLSIVIGLILSAIVIMVALLVVMTIYITVSFIVDCLIPFIKSNWREAIKIAKRS